jgi:hypothetical protein
VGVFAYPRKRVQSGISSRLENEPSTNSEHSDDNMHVDEAQIDGGNTEAVTASIMENPGKRP